MNFIRLSLAAIVLAAAAIVWQPGDVAAKCVDATSMDPVWVVDTEDLGPVSAIPEERTRAALAEGWRSGIGCRDRIDPVTGALIREHVVYVFTKAGAQRVIETYLDRLVSAQSAHHGAKQMYSDTFLDLEVFGLPQAHLFALLLEVRLDVESTGWAATIDAGELGLMCHVVVGEVSIPRLNFGRDVPTCITYRRRA